MGVCVCVYGKTLVRLCKSGAQMDWIVGEGTVEEEGKASIPTLAYLRNNH